MSGKYKEHFLYLHVLDKKTYRIVRRKSFYDEK